MQNDGQKDWPALLRRRREELGLSQEVVAERLRTSQPHVSRFELGKAIPPPALAKAIGQVYQLDNPQAFLDWTLRAKIAELEEKLRFRASTPNHDSKDRPIGVFEGEIEAAVTS